jgi:hypothetical protein
MELEEVNWRMVVVMVATSGRHRVRGLQRKTEAPRCVLLPRLACFLYRPASGRSDYNRLAALFPFPWAFITPGRLPAPRWLRAPSTPTIRLCFISPNPRVGCRVHVHVCVSSLGPVTCDSGRPSSYAFP